MVFQLSMYYLSFTPLWISIIFLDVMSLVHYTESPWVEKISIALIPAMFIIALIVMRYGLRKDKVNSQKYELKEAHEEKIATADFLTTFILPLLAFDFTTWEGMVIFAIFFFTFGYLCYRHNYFCTNIMLDIMCYRIYECELEDPNGVLLDKKVISKRSLNINQGLTIFAKKLNNDYCNDCTESGDTEEQED